jgi:hypothetical protein
MARLLIYTSFFKFKVSAQSLTKGVFEFVIRNCVVIDDPFINIGCEKTFVSEGVCFRCVSPPLLESPLSENFVSEWGEPPLETFGSERSWQLPAFESFGFENSVSVSATEHEVFEIKKKRKPMNIKEAQYSRETFYY